MTVTTVDRGTTCHVTWDRQARRNAWDLATMTEMADAIEAAGRDEAIRCVVVSGAGGHFSAGDDLQDALSADRAAWAATIEGFQRLTSVVLEAPVPVIAAIDGACVGGALEFAASCDLRLCSDRVTLLTPEVTIGLVLSNAGTWFLPLVLGEGAARELLLTGTPRDAAWAADHGFGTVVPAAELADRVSALAASFGSTSRAAVAATKAMLNQRFGTLLADAMERETRWCVDLFDGPDAPAALRSFAERRRDG